jgi:hypothetical protein
MDIIDFLAVFMYFVQWIFPAFMFFLYNYKTSIFNKAYESIYLCFMLASALFMLSAIYISYTFNIFTIYPTIYLVIFYGIISITFTYYLIAYRNWDFPQAFAVSIWCTVMGRYFWELPTIIYNLITIGNVVDILFQIIGLLFFFLIYITCGWKKDKKTMFAVLLGFIISILLLYFRSPVPPKINSDIALYWNSPYFMINRFINTVIVLYCVNKSKPMEKSRTNVNNKNTS